MLSPRLYFSDRAVRDGTVLRQRSWYRPRYANVTDYLITETGIVIYQILKELLSPESQRKGAVYSKHNRFL